MGRKRDWIAHGISERRFRTLVGDGTVIRLRHGIYALSEVVESADGDPARQHALLATAAIRATRVTAIASHQSAAILHCLDQVHAPDHVVTLTRDPAASRTRATASIRYHGAVLPPEHVTHRYGVPVTSAARTVADTARTSPFMHAVVIADSAIRKRKTSKAEISRVLDFCVRWPGVDAARRVVSFSTGRAESVLESCARVVFAEHGLPAPRLQYQFTGIDYDYRVDFYWPEYRTIAEADGLMKYEDPRRARSQLRRDRLLRVAGQKVVHFTWNDLFATPDRVVAWIKDAFRSAGPY